MDTVTREDFPEYHLITVTHRAKQQDFMYLSTLRAQYYCQPHYTREKRELGRPGPFVGVKRNPGSKETRTWPQSCNSKSHTCPYHHRRTSQASQVAVAPHATAPPTPHMCVHTHTYIASQGTTAIQSSLIPDHDSHTS